MARTNTSIKFPQNSSVRVKHKNGKAEIRLNWNDDFSSDWERRFSNVQRFVDSECIRLMAPYTPMDNGVLSKSAALSTKIGSGIIEQNAPYSRYQYYGLLMVSSINGSSYAGKGEKKVLTSTPLRYSTSRHPNAGKMWFERMKADKKEQILRGARKISERK